MKIKRESSLFNKQADSILRLIKADVSKLQGKINVPIKNDYWDGVTLLGIASMYGDKEAIIKLLDAGADPNQTYSGHPQKYTPLFTFIAYVNYTDLSAEDVLDIARLFVKNGANIDFIPEGNYKFDACSFAEYQKLDYLAAEFFRLGSDIEVREQNTDIKIKEYQAIRAKGIRYLAYEEYSKFLQDPKNYHLPKGLHKNTQKVLEQCLCSIDVEKNQITVTYQESDEYYRSRFEAQKQLKMFTGNEERFFKTEIYSVDRDKLKAINIELVQRQISFADIISMSKEQQKVDITSLEELLALYEIDGNSVKEEPVDLQGYSSVDDDFGLIEN